MPVVFGIMSIYVQDTTLAAVDIRTDSYFRRQPRVVQSAWFANQKDSPVFVGRCPLIFPKAHMVFP